ERRVIEGWIGRPSTTPAKRPAVGPGVLIDARQASVFGERSPATTGITVEAAEDQVLPRPDVEGTFTTVPVAGEHHCLRLGDLEMAEGVEMRDDLHLVPVQLALREGGPNRTEHEDEKGHAQRAPSTELHVRILEVKLYRRLMTAS